MSEERKFQAKASVFCGVIAAVAVSFQCYGIAAFCAMCWADANTRALCLWWKEEGSK